jgi:hypothetical protein
MERHAPPRDLSSFLLPGETVLWQGRPPTGILFRRRDLVVIPFTLMWTAGAFAWEARALGLWGKGDPNLCPAVCGLPFIAIGLFISVGRFYHEMKLRRQTAYLVTDQRILISCAIKYDSPFSLRYDQMPSVEFHTNADGTGTVGFGLRRNDVRETHGAMFEDFYGLGEPMFEHLADARTVYELVREQHDASLARAAAAAAAAGTGEVGT